MPYPSTNVPSWMPSSGDILDFLLFQHLPSFGAQQPASPIPATPPDNTTIARSPDSTPGRHDFFSLQPLPQSPPANSMAGPGSMLYYTPSTDLAFPLPSAASTFSPIPGMKPILISPGETFSYTFSSYTDMIEKLDVHFSPGSSRPANDVMDGQVAMEALVRPCKQHKSKLAILTTTAGQPCRVGKADVQQGQCPPCNAAELPLSLPNKVRDTIESSYLLQSLMERAKNHWCCIGFKVAPVTIDAIQNWKSAPVPIVYCVASIALVTFLDHQADPAFVKTAAMAFYQEARQKMDDFLFDEDDDAGHQYFTDDDDDTMTPRNHMTIQSYFCLSYTSNLLRLYDQQRTWGSLASIALQLRTKDAMSGYSPLPKPILLCFLRWYYVDAWMALTLRRETLVRDHPPVDLQLALISDPEHASLYHFATMTMFMRRYIHAMRNGQLMDPKTQMPTFLYHQITEESQRWYAQLNRNNSGRRDEHLHICYNAMRLVVMFQFLHPKNPPLDDGLVKDILETNLALLGSLQELSSLGCDQSTYHHMFFAIHNVACRIYLYYRHKRPSYRDGFSPIMSKWRKFSREQLRINLCLLKSTQAYANDVYQMRDYAKMIEEKFELIDIKPLPAILPLELAHSMAQSRMDADTPLPFSPNDGIISDGGSSPVSASSWASSVCSSPTPNSQPSHCPRSSITKPVKTRKSPHVKMKEVLGLPGVSVFEWKNARRRCKKSTASPPRRQPLPNALL